jgi:hypothetical protein
MQYYYNKSRISDSYKIYKQDGTEVCVMVVNTEEEARAIVKQLNEQNNG